MFSIDNFQQLRQLQIAGTCQNVAIFGADIAGKYIESVCRMFDIDVLCYYDNNSNKCGLDLNGVPVKTAAELVELHPDSLILIASTYIADIVDQVEAMGFMNWSPIVNLVHQIRADGLLTTLPSRLRINHSGGSFTNSFESFVLDNMSNSQDKYLDPDMLFIRSIDLILTEKCSLKCRDCANLMQYYEKPVNIATEELLGDIDDICAVADEINEIRIIGGEPLVHKDFGVVCAHAAKNANVNKVVVYTNGTIVGRQQQWESLLPYKDKIYVFITSYGALSRNIEPLSKMLDNLGISWNLQDAYGWTECGGIGYQKLDAATLKYRFRNCCARHFTTYTDGKIFRCPFSANAERLKAIPDAPGDYVDLRNASKTAGHQPLLEQKKRVRHFLRDLESIDACHSCAGRTYGDPEIVPGIQTKDTIAYEVFSRSSG